MTWPLEDEATRKRLRDILREGDLGAGIPRGWGEILRVGRFEHVSADYALRTLFDNLDAANARADLAERERDGWKESAMRELSRVDEARDARDAASARADKAERDLAESLDLRRRLAAYTASVEQARDDARRERDEAVTNVTDVTAELDRSIGAKRLAEHAAVVAKAERDASRQRAERAEAALGVALHAAREGRGECGWCHAVIKAHESTGLVATSAPADTSEGESLMCKPETLYSKLKRAGVLDEPSEGEP